MPGSSLRLGDMAVLALISGLLAIVWGQVAAGADWWGPIRVILGSIVIGLMVAVIGSYLLIWWRGQR